MVAEVSLEDQRKASRRGHVAHSHRFARMMVDRSAAASFSMAANTPRL